MQSTGRPPLYAPDYSNFHVGCDYCGKILSQVEDSSPLPCVTCNVTHYCNTKCIVAHFVSGHKPQCIVYLDAEIDMGGAAATTISGGQAHWDLWKFTYRWHDQLGDAAIAAMNLHADPTAMERVALVVRLSYVKHQPYRVRRFRLLSVAPEPIPSLTGTFLDAAVIRREENSIRNKQNGMVGCALVVLGCEVPGVGLVLNVTYIGPEASILEDPPPVDWQNRLLLSLKKNEL